VRRWVMQAQDSPAGLDPLIWVTPQAPPITQAAAGLDVAPEIGTMQTGLLYLRRPVLLLPPERRRLLPCA
jgi:hypothetical protein